MAISQSSEVNIPSPIVFGPEHPQLKVHYEGGRQYLYSTSNLNLYVTESDLDDRGAFSIGTLYERIRMAYWDGGTPHFAESQGLILPECTNHVEPCLMLVDACEEMQLEDGKGRCPTRGETKLTRLKLHNKPQLYECRLLSSLLGSVTKPAQKRLAETYYSGAICGVFSGGGRRHCAALAKRYGDFVQLWQERQLHLAPPFRKPSEVTYAILTSIREPALIPQVWLDFTYSSGYSSRDESDGMEHMVRCVDFLFIKSKKVHIIEIDEPSCYANFDHSKNRHDVDEEKYTYNLIAERILRKQGFEIHRLSSWEVLRATESELLELIFDVLEIPLYTIVNLPNATKGGKFQGCDSSVDSGVEEINRQAN